MEEEVMKNVSEKTISKIKEIVDSDITPNNLEHLDKLVDIYKDTKEVENMNYGNYNGNYGNYGNYGNSYGNNYGNYGRNSYGRGSYGEYGDGSYGRRGRDSKYRGDEYLDRMAGEYGRYSDSRERYGASEDTDRSFHYMVEALKDFIKVLHEEAETPQQKEMLRTSLQNSMM